MYIATLVILPHLAAKTLADDSVIGFVTEVFTEVAVYKLGVQPAEKGKLALSLTRVHLK